MQEQVEGEGGVGWLAVKLIGSLIGQDSAEAECSTHELVLRVESVGLDENVAIEGVHELTNFASGFLIQQQLVSVLH